MAPRTFEHALTANINATVVSRRGAKLISSLVVSPSQSMSSLNNRTTRIRWALIPRIILVLWTVSGLVGLMILCCICSSVDPMNETSQISRELTVALGMAYPNSTLAFSNFGEDQNPVQVIQTRFMQRQHHLLALGQARFDIFEAICLPTILAQSSKRFLWIIRADPELHPTLRERLIALVRRYPNMMLIGSNDNPECFRLDSSIADISPSSIWSGSYELLQRFHTEAQHRILIESRLDADDGLHYGFVAYTQFLSIHELSLAKNEWVIFCASSHLEWQLSSPFKLPVSGAGDGYLLGKKLGGKQLTCITPGLSYVYGQEVKRKDMPQGGHSSLHKFVPRCDNLRLKSRCIRYLDDLKPAAIRARTPTSAGMENVFVESRHLDAASISPDAGAKLQEEMWIGVHEVFNVERESVRNLRRSLSQELKKIVADNLEGQCTKGHSCKPGAKERLHEMLKKSTH